MLTRREVIKLTAFGMTIAGNVAWLEGCATGDIVINILNLLQPGVDGILPIVGLADPALMPVLAVAITTYDAAVATVTALYKNYEAALAANGGTAPSLLQQFKAALATLNTDIAQILAAAHVKNPATLTIIEEITSAVIAEIGRIIGIFTPPVTTQALAQGATTVTTLPTKAQLKAEHLAFKNRMLAILSRQTGDAALDAQTAKIAVSYH